MAARLRVVGGLAVGGGKVDNNVIHSSSNSSSYFFESNDRFGANGRCRGRMLVILG